MAGLAVTRLGFTRAGYNKIYRYEIESLDPDSIELDMILVIPHRGLITGFTVICPTSVDFGCWLAMSKGLNINHNDILLYTRNSNKIYQLRDIEKSYYNNDGTLPLSNELYFTLWNNDKFHACGVTTVEIVIDERGFDRSIN